MLNAKDNSVKTIPEKPKAGDEITVIYNPANTNLAESKNIDIVYSLYSINSSEPVHVEETHNAAMVKEEDVWKIKIKASSITEIIAVKFMDKSLFDNNDDNGYFIKFYDDNGNETTGSILGYATAINTWGRYLNFAAADQIKAFEIMKKVFTQNPELKAKYFSDYLPALIKAFPGKEKSDMMKKELSEIEKSNDLKDLDYYYMVHYYNNLNMPEKATEITKIALKKFPSGQVAFADGYKKLEAEKDINKRKEIAIELHKKISNYNRYVSRPLGVIFLDLIEQGKYEMLKEWWDYIKDKNWCGIESYPYFIEKMLGNKKLLWVALEICKNGNEYYSKEKIKPTVKKDNLSPEYIVSSNYKREEATFYLSYAKVLAELNKKNESAKQFEKAFSMIPLADFWDEQIKSVAKYLLELKEYAMAQPVLELAIKKGFQTSEMKDGLMNAYKLKNNDTAAFEVYYNKLVEEGKEKYLANMKQKMINQPAPHFTLVDLNDKQVSLSDYKGKVVILDFWATWCGPCKASFPAMQKTIENYKNDPDVVFLFVNTWQNEIDKKKNAQDFINENKYTFNVILDIENKVATDYKVPAIPTKFIIDRNGNIRFNITGGETGDEAVKNLTFMIELAKK